MIALLRAVAGLIAWAVAFSMIYGLQGLACALGWHEIGLAGTSVARLLLVASYAGWAALLLWLCLALRPAGDRPDLLARLAFTSAIVGLVSHLYTGMPVLATSVCS